MCGFKHIYHSNPILTIKYLNQQSGVIITYLEVLNSSTKYINIQLALNRYFQNLYPILSILFTGSLLVFVIN